MSFFINRRNVLRAGVAAVAAGALPGFLRSARAASPLIFQASWINDAEFTGYFVAIDSGLLQGRGPRPHLPARAARTSSRKARSSPARPT